MKLEKGKWKTKENWRIQESSFSSVSQTAWSCSVICNGLSDVWGMLMRDSGHSSGRTVPVAEVCSSFKHVPEERAIQVSLVQRSFNRRAEELLLWKPSVTFTWQRVVFTGIYLFTVYCKCSNPIQWCQTDWTPNLVSHSLSAWLTVDMKLDVRVKLNAASVQVSVCKHTNTVFVVILVGFKKY